MSVLHSILLFALGAAGLSATETFDTARTGSAPPGWKCGASGQGSPRWTVEAETSAPTKRNVLKQSGKADFPWCVRSEVALTDGWAEVRLKALSGEEDQAGGLIWRWKDASTYYIARANALEQNVTVFRVVGGRRRSFKSIDVPVSTNAWHTLRVEFTGPRVSVFFDGKRVIDAEDDTIKAAGAVGVWTKADSVTLFDQFQFGSKG